MFLNPVEEWLMLCSRHFMTKERAPSTYWSGGRVGLIVRCCDEKETHPSLGFEPQFSAYPACGLITILTSFLAHFFATYTHLVFLELMCLTGYCGLSCISYAAKDRLLLRFY